jgi:hypothetical protein
VQWYPMRIESGTKSRYSEPNNLLAAVKRLHETAIFQFFHKTVVNQLDDVHFLGFRSARHNFIQNEFGPGRGGVRDSLDDAVAELLPQRSQNFLVAIAGVLFQCLKRELAIGFCRS